MPPSGWKRLLDGAPWFRGAGTYPIAAYSEFMPPPRLGLKPYGDRDPVLFTEDDPCGWHVTEFEEVFQLRPGLEKLGRQVVDRMTHLCHNRPAHGIARNKLRDNPCWPPHLAERACALPHERYVVLLPVALSRTQDDKGRIRWSLFGGSEQGPARPFWKCFFAAPGREVPEEHALDFFRTLLHTVYGEMKSDLHRAGLRILPVGDAPGAPYGDGDLPSWTKSYLWAEGQPLAGMKYLLTFRPFAQLPDAVQQGYLAGRLHLLPFPGSLLVWTAPPFLKLSGELPLAVQVPLLNIFERQEELRGIRVPQSGWMHEPRHDEPAPDNHHGPLRNSYKRTHRWARVHRHENELEAVVKEDKVARVLFSTKLDDLGLYDKPMARNAQVWTHEYALLLDGPHADRKRLLATKQAVDEKGGLFGYRFVFPAMRVGTHEVYWHRPLVAYLSAETGQPVVLPEALLGYMTAYAADRPDPGDAVELWPRLLQREPYLAALKLFDPQHDTQYHRTSLNVRKLLDTCHLLGDRPLPHEFARSLLSLPKERTLDAWLDSLPEKCSEAGAGAMTAEQLRDHLKTSVVAPAPEPLPDALTYGKTARRSFELSYWKTIATLAEGKFINKDNADCVLDPATQKMLAHHERDLEALGKYLLAYYRKLVAARGLGERVLVGDLPFTWQTDFVFDEFGGWLANQQGTLHERDLLVVIPGRDRGRAVIMADHYDTAYMADHYEKQYGGNGARLAAAGADDNHSATAALMLGAPVFMDLSAAGKLDCDVWLVHLTGEEFPADCLGARHLCQWLVEGTLHMRLEDGSGLDLSGVRVQGVYVLDMVAHNNDRDRDIFQMAPGTSRESMWLGYQAHLANAIWNASVPAWNRRSSRRGKQRGRRSPFGSRVPETALHPHLYGEVRPAYDPRSTLYNTDGQIFSDAGVPVVLFMENYDINRTGYHDSHDTMANIDLDYGAAVAAIAIEAVARAASATPGEF
jgi:hypothetical protein